MIGWGQSDIDSIKHFFGVLPCFDDNFDKKSENYRHELTQSMISAYHKLKAIFPPKGGSVSYATPSTSQMHVKHVNMEAMDDCHHGYDIKAMSVSSSSKQVSASWSKRRFPNTKNYKYIGQTVYRPKLVHLRRESLVVNHALNSRLAKRGEFYFFHQSGLASVTMKVTRPSTSSYGSNNPGSDFSICSMGVDEPIADMEKMTEVQDNDPNDKHDFSDDVSCLSMEKQQSSNIVAKQTSNDQVMDLVSLTTLGGAQKRKKRSRRQLVHKGVSLLSPHSRINNKTGKRKGSGRRLAYRIIGCNGYTMACMPTHMVTPCKRARQSITIELVIDPALVQAF